MPIAYKITIKGKVQGVFYRASTREKAIEIGLNGWCMNLENGDVLIHAEGERVDLNALLLWCKVGPPKAKVDQVLHEETDLKGYSSFKIKRA